MSERKQMRKASTLIGLTLVALGAGARAEESAPPAPAPATAVVVPVPAAVPAPAPAIVAPFPAAPPSQPQRWRIGLSFLPMGLGKLTTPIGGNPIQGDASLAYGVGLSASYRIIAGFSVGVAPQIISNVNYKVPPAGAAPDAVRETDLLARLAYTFPVVDTIGLYVEALPGYSLLPQAGGSAAKGFVVAFDAGADMGITDRIFANLGAGYQLGFQSLTVAGEKVDTRTRYVRVSLGGGVRF
jgi:hypothetical protein